MRLIELSSSKSSFKTVRFNRIGLSLIVARHTQKDIRATYNGVGKSLVITLLHYCLGSNKNAEFEKHLDGWDFSLKFEHKGNEHFVTRTVGNDEIVFDGKKLKLKPYREKLDTLDIFQIPGDVDYVSFRSLINYFLRPTRGSFEQPDAAVKEWTPYQRLLCQSVLLGLDYFRVIEKHDARKKHEEVTALAKKFKTDKELRDFYVGDKNVELELAALKEKIEALRDNLQKFQVAKDYGERQAEANALHERIQDARNNEVMLAVQLENIELSLRIRPDVTPELVKQMYNEAEIELPDTVVKRLTDVEKFYERLRQNRLKRLEQEKKAVLERHRASIVQRKGWEVQLDGLFHFLKAHQALDEYTENNRYLTELLAKAKRFEDYLSLVSKYTEEAQKIRAEMGKATLQATEYLKKITPLRDLLMETFRGYAHEFYGDKPAGLVVKNNDKEDNQIRFTIETRIEHDAADGINDVRIFCFDLLLLTLKQRHAIDFLFHDSRLFDAMDFHQRLTLLKTADRFCRQNNLQYIASLNEDHIESVQELAGKDFARLCIKPQILELTDAPEGKGKLLGIQVNMDYRE